MWCRGLASGATVSGGALTVSQRGAVSQSAGGRLSVSQPLLLFVDGVR